MKKYVLSVAALGLLVGIGNATACELGGVRYNAAGEQQVIVLDSQGLQVGMTMQGRDGRWEAVIDGLGALNQRYVSARAAAQAICREAQR